MWALAAARTAPPPLARRERLALVALTGGWLAIALAVLPAYGAGTDEWDNFQSGDSLLAAVAKRDLNTYFIGWNYEITGETARYPPVANLASAATGWLLHDRLDLLGYVDAHHVAVVLFGAAGIPAAYLLARRVDPRAGPYAAVLYATHPFLFAHAHANVKDLPLVVMEAWTLVAFLRWFATARYRDGLVAAALLGLTVNVKPSALVLPLALALAFAAAEWPAILSAARSLLAGRQPRAAVVHAAAVVFAQVALVVILARLVLVSASWRMLTYRPGDRGLFGESWGWPLVAAVALLALPVARTRLWDDLRGSVRFAQDVTLMAAASVGAFFLSWPLLWREPMRELVNVWLYFRSIGTGYTVLYFGEMYQNAAHLFPGTPWSPRPWHYAPGLLALQTPLLVLVLGLAGAAIAVILVARRRPGALAAAVLVLWLALPVLRVLSPNVPLYDASRNLLDAATALVVLAGVGAAALAHRVVVVRRLPSRTVLAAGLAIVVVVQGGLAAALHPYGASHFNVLVGGPAGAEERFDVVSWDSPTRDVVRELNARVPAGATVQIVGNEGLARHEGLREDIVLVRGLRNGTTGPVLAGDYVAVVARYSVLYYELGSVDAARDALRATRAELTSVVAERRFGATIFEILQSPPVAP